jgi:hypothetical protein
MTAEELIALWAERDARYRLRKTLGVRHALSPDEASSVRAWRMHETNDLPLLQRIEARARLASWQPPRVAR